MIRVLAHSVIGKLSPFAREMDFGLEWTFIESGNTVYKYGTEQRNAFHFQF